MYTGLLAMALVSVVLVVVVRAVALLATVSRDPLISTPDESGWLPTQHALSRFHARWYVATVVFLAFDVEMLFMYPWAVVVAELGAGAVIEMFVFLGALLLAVFWARREGAFRWA